MTIKIAPGTYRVTLWQFNPTCTVFETNMWQLFIYHDKNEVQLIPAISGMGISGKLFPLSEEGGRAAAAAAAAPRPADIKNGAFAYKIDGFTLTGEVKGGKIPFITIIV